MKTVWFMLTRLTHVKRLSNHKSGCLAPKKTYHELATHDPSSGVQGLRFVGEGDVTFPCSKLVERTCCLNPCLPARVFMSKPLTFRVLLTVGA